MQSVSELSNRRVPLSEIWFAGVKGWLLQRPKEGRTAYTNRICAQAGSDMSAKPTILKYLRAMKRGDKFGAVMLVQENGMLEAVDGFHRLRAAALHGAKAIEATVITGMGTKTDAVLDFLYDLDFYGAPAWAALTSAAAAREARHA